MKNIQKAMIAGLFILLASLSCKTLQGADLPASPATSAPPTASGPTPTVGPTLIAPISSNQPYEITGAFKSTQEDGGQFVDNILYAERQVILVDLHGFITRDKRWVVPVNSQVIGNVQYNPQDASGSYTLFLPEIPQGTLNDLDNNGQHNAGVQVFVIDYKPNIAGNAFMSGDDRLKGWPNDMASIKTNPDQDNEVTGGQLIVYAPDAKESFPTGFGPDGKLFTADDPVAALPAGYSIINLDAKPFTFTQPPQANLPLFEAPDAGPKDYSKESYTQAFDDLLKFLRTNYAFSGIAGKAPDWDSLAANIRPRIQQAEQNHNAAGFYAALHDFTYAFRDGHVGMDGGDLFTNDFRTNYAGGLGFTVRVLDNNQVLASSVLSGGPAEAAGMKAGAVITQFNGKPVMDVIKSEPLFFENQSSDIAILYNKAIMLTRTKPGGQADVTFTNPGGSAKTTTLTANPEVDTLLAQLGYNKASSLVPVELNLLSSNNTDIGYIKLNSNSDDLNLLLRLFEHGLKKFQEQKVTRVIVDLRNNGGGVPLGLAGFLTNQEIPLGQMEYYDNTQGKFIPKGPPDTVTANENQYHFDKIAVLVGLNCASACELEAYAMSKVPGAIVVGQYPTGGIEAEVSRGQIKMPENIGMQFPTGREVNPDGSLFLEGVGVQPTLKVPVDANSVLSSADIVLQAAENALTGK